MTTHLLRSVALSALIMLSAASVSAQNWIEVLQVLPPNDNSSPIGGQSDEIGRAVAMFGDYAVIGAPHSDINGPSSGTAFIFEHIGGSWTLVAQVEPADGGAEDRFGWSAAIQDSSIIIGAPGDSPVATSSGSAYVFDRIGGVWTETAKVHPAVAASYDEFGTDVDIAGDILIGSAPYEDQLASNSGATFVFENVGGTWTEQLKLTASDGAVNDFFGLSIALDDTTVFCGAYGSDALGGNRGAVYRYRRDSGLWPEIDKVIAPDAANGDQFGIALAADQGRLVVGSKFDDDGGNKSGSAYVYAESGGVYSFEQKLTASDEASNDEFGSSVDISGTRIVVGAQKNDDGGESSGSIYVFDLSGTWTEVTKLIAFDDAAQDRYGFSVGVADGSLLTGSRLDDDAGINSGSVYFYDLDTGTWTLDLKSSDNDMIDDPTEDNFGSSVSLSWDNALVASYRDDDFGASSGSVRFYGFDGSQWQDFGKVYASAPDQSDNFGLKTAISGNVAVIGALGDDDKGNNAGAAYIFEKGGASWTQTKKLTAGDGEDFDNFGWSVGIDGDVIAIGAYLDDDNANGSGAVYIYEYDGSDWGLTAKMISSDGGTNQHYGYSVDVEGDMIVVGARDDGSQETSGGSAYVLQKIGGTWTEVAKLEPNVVTAQKFFGYSVSISEGVVIVGAIGDLSGGSNSGAAYVFTDSGGWGQRAKLKPNDIISSQYFGISVDNVGDYAVIGAYGSRDTLNVPTGAVYLFEDTGAGWNQVDSLYHSGGLVGDQFGLSVAIKGKTLLAGAPNDDDNGDGAGAGYFFADCIDDDMNGVCDYEEILNENNVCDSAIAVTSALWGVAGWDTLSFLGANESISGCSGDADDDIWFSFVAQHANDAVVAQDPTAGFNAVIEIFESCGGQSLGCFDNYGPGEAERAMPGGLVSGQTYVYRVYDSATGHSASTDVRTQVKTFAFGGIRNKYCGVMDFSLDDVITPMRQDLNQLYPFTTTNVRGYGLLFIDDLTGDSISIEQFGQVSQYFHLGEIPGLEYNRSYTVMAKHSIRINANGAADFKWSDYGPSCTIALAGPIETEVKPQFCDNAIGYDLSDHIQAYPVPYATHYRFTLDDGVDILTKTGSAYTLPLYQVAGISLNKTYDVTVQSRVNGLWSPAGTVCTINMLSQVPNIGLQTQFCGGSYAYPSAQYLLAENVQGADEYQWRFTPSGGGLVQLQNTSGLSLAFHWATDLSLVAGSSYDVAVRARIGSIWGSFNSECTIDLFASSPGPDNDDVVDKGLSNEAVILRMWPNPVVDELRLEIEGLPDDGPRMVLIQIHSMDGAQVYESYLPVKGDLIRHRIALDPALAEGIYHLSVQDGVELLKEVFHKLR